MRYIGALQREESISLSAVLHVSLWLLAFGRVISAGDSAAATFDAIHFAYFAYFFTMHNEEEMLIINRRGGGPTNWAMRIKELQQSQ